MYPISHYRRKPILFPGQLGCVENTTEFEEIIDHENLLAAFYEIREKGDRAAGVDKIRAFDIGRIEAAEMARSLSAAIRGGRYCPQPFRTVSIPKAQGTSSETQRYRKLQIPTVADRCVSHAVHRAIGPFVDARFDDRSLGFRPGRGIWNLLVELEREIPRNNGFLLQMDIEDAFPSIPLRPLLQHVASLIGNESLVLLIERIVRLDRTREPRGLSQGDPLSPLLANLALHHTHDQLQSQFLNRRWFRYVDNLTYLATSSVEARRIRESISETLAKSGLRIRVDATETTVLQGGSAEILGFQIGSKDGQLTIEIGDKARGHLQALLEECVRSSRPDAHRDVVRSWILSNAPALDRSSGILDEVQLLCSSCQIPIERHHVLAWIKTAQANWRNFRSVHLATGEE
ncbi:reverse transcriptase domain-containing protein [Planctomyces sp. SH-PL14]|uniref:reverse transcriptase domain-containing protein n=1 Tax=Planctomyces sp. SH-PL14 TaxID=1632864 RepID=UPI00078D0BC8|nr:reverse transcriptase domain-containing protein [Planctomyces sp. SH-PL14]AMV16514.1 Group II intron-encoded protein LtrA [Planctomyces sp. SH-PL14]